MGLFGKIKGAFAKTIGKAVNEVASAAVKVAGPVVDAAGKVYTGFRQQVVGGILGPEAAKLLGKVDGLVAKGAGAVVNKGLKAATGGQWTSLSAELDKAPAWSKAVGSMYGQAAKAVGGAALKTVGAGAIGDLGALADGVKAKVGGVVAQGLGGAKALLPAPPDSFQLVRGFVPGAAGAGKLVSDGKRVFYQGFLGVVK